MSMVTPQLTYENHLDEQEARWFAVYTRYKREKVVRKQLEDKGIVTYLPLQKLVRRYTRKVKHVELPLISCYIFTKIKKSEYVPVLETPDVVNFVKFSKNLIAIPEEEIHILQRVVGENIEVDVDQNSYQEGDEVQIIGGQLTGLKGKLVKTDSNKNFVVELENLGYSLRMEIPGEFLIRIGPAGR